MRDCNVVNSGLEDEIPDSDVKCIYKEVVVIGNGPSGITLSYLLSGHRPYYNRIPHPDPLLSARLIECSKKSLLHQDLPFLAQGVEGRSKNPISLLIDAMTHPGADIGLEWPSLITWKKTTKSLDHIILGKGDPGGTWPRIADHVMTISPGRWMALPGLDFKDYHDKRAPASAVAKYYMEYIKKNDLTANMASHSTVTMIQPIVSKSRKRARWKVWVNDANGGTLSYECRYLVLATGATDKAGCLGVLGESLPYVTHDLKTFEKHLSDEQEKTFFIKDAVTSLKGSKNEKNQLPPFLTNEENVPKNKTKSYRLPNEFDYSLIFQSSNNTSKHFVAPNQKDFDFVKLGDGGPEMAPKDEINRIETLSNFEKSDYSKEFLNDHFSKEKTSENVFKPGDDVWFSNNEKETDFSISKLSINNTDFLDGEKEGFKKDENKKVLVVGAGLSAADAILAAWSKKCFVVHAFRSPITTAQLPAVMYPEYHELYQLMRGFTSRKDYQRLPGYQITEINKNNTVQLMDSLGSKKTMKVFSVAILIGSQPDLFFLPKTLRNLGTDDNKPVDCKVNPVQIDPFTYKCVKAPPGLYAMGPLVGDNFVRFLQGGAIAIAAHIFKDNFFNKNK